METKSNTFVKPDIVAAYKVTFNSEFGELVLKDLKRIANLTKIDATNPNQLSAVYKCAQMALLARIGNVLGKPDDDITSI